jgi:uncharacterized protein
MSVSVIENPADSGILPFSEDGYDQLLGRVQRLTEAHKTEALDFLAGRPIYSVCMASYIRDNGVISAHNRGAFYGYRNARGRLIGVALIGHATLIETKSDDALRAFARVKQAYRTTHFIRGEQKMIERFWTYYAQFGHRPRLVCRELLFELTSAREFAVDAPTLQSATLDDLEEIAAINASIIVDERGVNPLQTDPTGFRERLARRIKQGRFWLVKENGHIVFKADVFAETPEMAYLEGIYVHAQARGRGLGLRCLTQLGTVLLTRSRATCLLMNEKHQDLARFYRRAGYEFRGFFDTIYLNAKAN